MECQKEVGDQTVEEVEAEGEEEEAHHQDSVARTLACTMPKGVRKENKKERGKRCAYAVTISIVIEMVYT